MDIFNRKKVKELETKLWDAERDRNRFRMDLAEMKAKFEELGKLEETIPADCKKGPWCAACGFVRTYTAVQHHIFGGCYTTTGYACGKGESCKNFVQKNFKEE